MKEIFEFLDDLRESGVINMFGAPQVLMDEFGMTKVEAKETFIAWTEHYYSVQWTEQFGNEE